MRGYIPPADDDERLFVRRLGDLVQAVRQRGTSRSTPFLSDRQQELARAALAGLGFEGYAFDGGYPDAERRILRLFGEYGAQEPLPAVCLFAQTLRADRALTHRDYLGALMSLGIRRECIGDILLSEDGTYLFVLDTVAPLVCDELSSVGRCSVCVRAGRAEELPVREEPGTDGDGGLAEAGRCAGRHAAYQPWGCGAACEKRHGGSEPRFHGVRAL